MSEMMQKAPRSAPFLKKGERLTVEILDLNNLGCGVGRLPDGRAVFVAGAVAGDVAEIELIKLNKTYAVGRLLALTAPSPDREEGFCSAPLSCGGCVYRHLTYERELALKRDYVTHCFRKAGLSDVTVLDVRHTGEVCGYRNKAEYPIAADKNGLYGGFYAQKTHRVVRAGACSLQPAVFGEILSFFCDFYTKRQVPAYDEETGKGLLRHLYLREGKHTGELMVCPVLSGKELPFALQFVGELLQKFPQVTSVVVNENTKRTNVVLGDKYHTLYGNAYIEDILCGKRFRVMPASFYQVNHDAAELLYGIAADMTGLSGEGLLLDLYCGAGTIGLSMAERVGEIVGIEIVPDAIRCANVNKELNGVENATFYCGDAANTKGLLAAAEQERGTLHPDVVVLDPPRKGCDEGLLRFLAARRVPRIVYVSCGPDTLARDCAILKELGYEIGEVTPVDLFPRTGHVESVVCLTRRLDNELRERMN